ncbi:lamin-like protein, partial [Biomphalaria glabrata]
MRTAEIRSRLQYEPETPVRARNSSTSQRLQYEPETPDWTQVISKAKSWIDDPDSQNFVGMNRYLTNETSRCLLRCRDLT